MREIKFRGFSKVHNKWLFGSMVNNLWETDKDKKPCFEIIDNSIGFYDC